MHVARGDDAVTRERGGGTAVPYAVGANPLNLRQSRRNSSVTSAGVGAPVPDPVGSYHPPSRQKGESCSMKREGGGTTVPDPVRTYPHLPVKRENPAVS